MILRFFYFFLFSLLFSISSFAQKPIWTEIALEEETNLKFLQTDTVGFIWGLSENGLYKYDGFELSTKIDKLNATSTFTSIAVDEQYNFLIGTNKGELIHFNPYKIKIVKRQVKIKDLSITSIACNVAEKSCLYLSYGNGVLWQTPEIDTFLTTENILVSNEVYASVVDNGKAILATDQGIQIIEIKDKQLSYRLINKSNGLGDVIIPNLIKDKEYLWASNFDSEIYKIDISSLSTSIIDMPVKSEINGIKIINGKELIVFTNDGLYSLTDDNWIKKYPNNGSQEILDITIDEENNLWACNGNNILSKANLGFLLMPNTVDNAHAILKIEKSFWIGSSEGLFIVEGKKKLKILDNNITCLKRIKDDILVGTYSSGIHILNKNGKIIKSIDGWENNPNQSVLYIYPSKDYLYISSLTGVTRLQLTKNKDVYTATNYKSLNDILGPGYIYQILENGGDLYFATDRQGIKIIRNDSLRHFTHFGNGNTLGSIYSMASCEAGIIWFASSTGYIGYVKDQEVHYVNNERFLQDPYTSLIITDDQQIIMVRNASIDVYDPKSNHFLYYNDIIQIPDLELYLNCFDQDEDGIWLAKPNGVLKIEKFNNLKISPETVINQVMVNLTDIGDKNNYAEDQNNLEFKYSAAWMSAPERITYQYKLDGLEENWRTTRDQSALYPMLRPGTYTFRIRASENDKFDSEPEKSFQFTIRRSFYKTWWFLLIMLLLFGGIIRKWRNERKKVRQQKEALNKKRIEAQLISLQTQLNPHFLFNSFNTLIGLIEENPAKSITFTEKLTDFYRNILEFGKNDLINLKDEIKLLETYIHLIKERFGEQLQINIDLKDISSYKIPPLTLQLLIENAIKHNIVSSKNPLIVDIKQEGETILVSNKIQLKYGNTKGTGIGLNNIKKRHTLNNLRPPNIEQNDTHFIITIYLNSIEE